MKKIALIICLAIALGGVSPGIGTADENDNRAQIVVISDIHLGADDAIGETTENKGHLLAFLKRIRASETVAELVIAGDLIDQW
ncbi:MAG: metallophosphoesterase, partial [Eubacteriales bacterium]|nr:metallophosphoesterase [Eubacteriales bacterium]